MASRVDNMNLPPNLEEVDSAQVLKWYQSRFARENREVAKYPMGRDLNDFFPLVHEVLLSKERAENVEKFVLFVEEDPPEALDTETITFRIQSRAPGQFSQGPAGSATHKEVRHHIRSIVDHPEHATEKLVTMGKFYDNHIRFNVYARTNKRARERLLWFTSTMDSYLWFFALNSFKVIEKGVGDRERPEIDGLTVTRYPVSYYVRSEDVRHLGTQEIKQILLTLSMDSE